MSLIDLSHVILEGMTTYPGLPAPSFEPHLTREASRSVYAEGVEFAIDRITMVGNTGTYLDSPFHRYEGGTDLAGLPLTSVADLPTLVVRASSRRAASPSGVSSSGVSSSGVSSSGASSSGASPRAVDAELLSTVLPDARGHAVLLHTGGDRHWGTPEYAVDAPYLSEDGANFLVEAGVALVGIDSVNIDQVTSEGFRPAHSILLGAEIPVLEHLTNLEAVPDTGARLHAAPPPVRNFGTFPVRAYVVV